MQSLARRLENGGALTCAGVDQAAQPFFAVLLRNILPGRPLVLVAADLKIQESFQQDIETWLSLSRGLRVENRERKSPDETGPRPSPPDSRPLFYPPWEVFPHEGKLPHADTISDRLQTLVTLSGQSETRNPKPEIIITCVTALLQKTFPPGEIRKRARALRRGDKINPLDLIEWLEEQGYEPEAQVTRKGEIALRGGILDVWPPTSPWPARLEFFGDELESLRHFDPLTQISREEIFTATIPPAGELGILKQWHVAGNQWHENRMASERQDPVTRHVSLATLLDYLPRETIFLVCEPEQLAARAEEYASQIPASDPFFISWERFLADLDHQGMTRLELSGEAVAVPSPDLPATLSPRGGERNGATGASLFSSLDVFRPLAERAPEPQIAEAQRREFFQQLHRWLRQDYAVHVFCNNDGERQRFEEIWTELVGQASSRSPSDIETEENIGDRLEARPTTRIGSLARGFLCDEARLVVVTDAEIFGRYKIQRPRRLKSPHALATRSALDIDFTELEDGDLVVHLQYGIGKFLGLKNLPTTTRQSALSPARLPGSVAAEVNRRMEEESDQECLVIEYAPAKAGDEPPKLYVPVTEAHLVGKYVGAGKSHPPLNTLGGTRWKKAKEQAERAVRDVAAELLQIQAARETQAGHAFKPDAPWQREFESAFIFEETPDQWRAIQETKSDMEKPKPMDRLICGDVGFGKTEVAIRAAFKAVMDGRQVAVLVPTTVLAQQHFNVFRERMADYPVRIELLSRFRTRRQQQRVVEGSGKWRGGHRHWHTSADSKRHHLQRPRPGGD